MDLFSASVAYASVDSFIGNVNREIINPLILFLFALAVAYFLFGLVQFIWNGANDEKKTTGKSHMLWGVIGITIMMGVWAILGIILSTLEIKDRELRNSSQARFLKRLSQAVEPRMSEKSADFYATVQKAAPRKSFVIHSKRSDKAETRDG